MIYDYLIVGAGISGLNTGVEILKRKPEARVVILERNPIRTGGRVYTDKFKLGETEHAFDAGAGRFSNTHKRLLSLISNYSLDSKVMKISNGSVFKKTREYSKSLKYKDADSIVRELLKAADSMTKSEREKLKGMTFKEFAAKLFNEETAEFLERGYPYYSEISIINAYTAIKAFKNDLNSNKNFYFLYSGLSQITDCLTRDFRKRGGKLILGYSVKDISKHPDTGVFSIIPDNQEISVKRARNVILTMPKNVLQRLDFLSPLKREFSSLECKPLYRIYAVYPKDPQTGLVWCHDIKRTITDSRIKYIIPINPEAGSIMISYTDGPNADYWRDIPDDKLVARLHREVKKLYPEKRDIPEPLAVKKYYWNTGACYYRKGSNPTELQRKMINPLQGIYICGDSFSNHQAWMEGALETSENVVKAIFD